MKLLKSFLFVCLACFAMTSCLSDDGPSQTVRYNLNYNLSLVYDNQSTESAPVLLDGAKYEFDFNVIDSKVNITIRDLQVSATGSRYTFAMKDLKYKVDNEGTVVVSVPAITIPMKDGKSINLTSLVVRQNGAVVNTTQNAVYYDISYTFDDRYDVRAIQTSNLFNAKVEVTTTVGEVEQTKTTYTSYVGYKIDLQKRVALLSLGNINIDGTNRSEINFMSLPFATSMTSGVQFSPDNSSLKAYDYAQKEIKNFEVTDFAARLSYSPEVFASFKVNDNISVKIQASYKSLKPTEPTPKN